MRVADGRCEPHHPRQCALARWTPRKRDDRSRHVDAVPMAHFFVFFRLESVWNTDNGPTILGLSVWFEKSLRVDLLARRLRRHRTPGSRRLRIG